jgi:cytidine deaminase
MEKEMNEISNNFLIEKALSILNPKMVGDKLIGDVGCALLSEKGNVYLGVCIDVGSGIGFCAEHSAIAAMITAGEYRIKKIVAVWRDDKKTCILSPCGRCREFMRQIDEKNLETEIIMERDKVLSLRELLPYANWFHKISSHNENIDI